MARKFINSNPTERFAKPLLRGGRNEFLFGVIGFSLITYATNKFLNYKHNVVVNNFGFQQVNSIQ